MIDRSKIEDVLIKIGIPARLKGFTYICDAIELLSEDINMKMTKELYPHIGEKYGASPQAVYRAVGVALDYARDYGETYGIAEVDHYIGAYHCENSNSLKRLCTVLKNEQEESIQSNANSQITEDMVRKIVREELETFLSERSKK